MRSNKIDGGFVIIPKNTLRSEEWRSLTAGTRLVYITILTEFIRDKKSNPENEVQITHREIEARSGLGHSTVVRAMKKLKTSAFLEVAEQGGLEMNYSVYKLARKFLY